MKRKKEKELTQIDVRLRKQCYIQGINSYQRLQLNHYSTVNALYTHIKRSKKRQSCVHGLVSLFNGISAFVGYLMPKPFSKKYISGII